MMEDQVRGRIYNSRFVNNTANQGGALSSYRTSTEVQNCTFQNNQAVVDQGANRVPEQHGYGGAIVLLSDDNADESTERGTKNRPSASLTITDSIIRGNGAAAARQGGGMFVAGDLHAAFGQGVEQKGTLESNRANVNIKRVAFLDLATADALANNGTGGALTGDFANILIEESIVTNCKTSQNGGGLDFARGCVATVKNTTLAGNSAGNLGGAVASFGGEVNLTSCSMTGNTAVADGGYGTAITTVDDPGEHNRPGFHVTGVVQNTVISSNKGLFAIYDGRNPRSEFFNRVQYNNNKFFEAAGVFVNDDGGPKTLLDLNALSLLGSSKSSGGNTVAGSAPEVGAALMIPPLVLSSGAPGEATPLASLVAFAGSGGGMSVDGARQSGDGGALSTTDASAHTLTVGSASFRTKPVAGKAANISTRLAVGRDDDALIGGFFVLGSAPKRVLIRAIGPSSGVAGALQDPQLELYKGAEQIATNDNWRATKIGGALTVSQAVDIVATTVPPASDLESAIVATLDPGDYTAVVRGAGGGTGVGLVEVYDLDAVQNSTLANISTRGFIQGGDNVMIGGFIYLGGPGATKVAVRAIGPSLGDSGVAGAVSDPTLDVVDANGKVIASKDDWSQSPDANTLGAVGLQPKHPAESALLATGLRVGQAYTAIVRGKNGGTGVGLVEAYIYE